MSRAPQLRMVSLKLPQIGLRAFQNELTAVRLDFLLCPHRRNWVCPEMVREWLRERNQPPRGFRSHPERWQVEHWEQVLGRCEGEQGDLLFDCESVQVTKEDEVSFGALFKTGKHSKNGYVKDVEVDTYSDEEPASTPSIRLKVEDEPRKERAPRKRKWDAGPDQSEQNMPAAPIRRQTSQEPTSRPKQKARKLVLPMSSAETGRVAEMRHSPSSLEDIVAKILGRIADPPAPKAQTPSAEALAFGTNAFGGAPSAQRTSDQLPSAMCGLTLALTTLAQAEIVHPAEEESRREETRVPSAQTPSAIAERTGEAGPTEARSPTPLEILAGSGAAVAAEEAARPSAGESPRTFVATEILDSDDEESSEEEVGSVQGKPTGVLCER
ncbi:hypothetical protein AXG93_694s1020 [Marchantia polymorpha subsp. ruderalis]|uniref:Uncharacterized protein n=1 Tax=Marchantia polymorpha subsp. ruderalis TaxID=1480154 RepID=A0A176W417_MARPO|nr:hypothetical protein AXG93_694s1020 [Marchantia polymorpha subsp. ruderalis]